MDGTMAEAEAVRDDQARLSTTQRFAMLRYMGLRLAIFLVALGVLWGVVAATGHVVTVNGGLYLSMGALLVSGIASFFLLNRQRDAVSTNITARADRITRRINENAANEDEDQD
jgi:Protein of unknown function (DUF4229)